MPHRALHLSRPDDALLERLARLRHDQSLPESFSPEALAEAERAAVDVLAGLDSDAGREDLTAFEFVTIDPFSSTDLDQALFLEHADQDGATLRVHYAIADVPAFVEPDGALDEETRQRGQTVYLPDGRVPLHPEPIGEQAGSLLPDQDRPAFVWTMDVAADGALGTVRLARARVRSRHKLSYAQVQALLDADRPEAQRAQLDEAAQAEVARTPTLSEGVLASLRLLPELGRRRREQESARGGASLNLPDQEVRRQEPGQEGESAEPNGGWRIVRRVPLPVEEDNAQVSLMTGMAAAAIMLEHGVGVLRTMPAPEPEAVAEFRAKTVALGHPWPEDVDYGEFLRGVDPTRPRDLAVLHAATSLFRGAGYTAFDVEAEDEALRTVPDADEAVQAALAAPYAHTTAPLRRLVDRFVLVCCHAHVQGEPVPAWVRRALPLLPELMADSSRRAAEADRAAVDLVEAALLAERVGHRLEGSVVRVRGADSGGGHVDVQLDEPPIALRVPLADGAGPAAGDTVLVRVVAVDVDSGEVTAALA